MHFDFVDGVMDTSPIGQSVLGMCFSYVERAAKKRLPHQCGLTVARLYLESQNPQRSHEDSREEGLCDWTHPVWDLS